MDWAMSGRRDVFRFFAVDPFSLEEVSELEAEPSDCSITYGYYTDNKVQADLTLVGNDYRFDGLSHLVRVKHAVFLPDGTEEQEVLGTFFVEHPERHELDGIVRYRLNCYSTMWRLSQDVLHSDFVQPAGYPCEAGIRRLVEWPGGTLVNLGGIDTAKLHTVDVRFACGDNRLESINEYCGWLNWALNVDDYGRQTLSPYVAPQDRSVAYEFQDGSNCIYLPDMDEDYTGEVYNKVIVRWSREKDPGDGMGLYGRYDAELERGNPYSWSSYGAWLPALLDLTEPATYDDMKAKGDAFLKEHDGSTRYITIRHVGVPNLRPGMVVRYTQDSDTTNLCEITQMSFSGLRPLLETETKLKVIA